MADADGWIKLANDSELNQIAAVVANFSGAVQGIEAVISLYDDTESDVEMLLDAVDGLRKTLDSDFKALGDTIARQTDLIVNAVNRDAMATALAHSDAALDRMQDFLANGESEALGAAKTESILGLRFFTELGLAAPDLGFFLPGMVKAGIGRILTIAGEPAALKEPRSVVTNDVSAAVTYLDKMIQDVKANVRAAHTVVQETRTALCPGHGPSEVIIITIGFHHEQTRGGRTEDLSFHSAQRGQPICQLPNPFLNTAWHEAEEDWQQGVANEQTALSIASFGQVLQSWTDLLNAQ